eukprot:Awhi_evm1s225
MLIGIPAYSIKKSRKNKQSRKKTAAYGTLSIVAAPIIATTAIVIGVPVALSYVYIYQPSAYISQHNRKRRLKKATKKKKKLALLEKCPKAVAPNDIASGNSEKISGGSRFLRSFRLSKKSTTKKAAVAGPSTPLESPESESTDSEETDYETDNGTLNDDLVDATMTPESSSLYYSPATPVK